MPCCASRAGGDLVRHNPSIDGTSRGDGYECLAPYDIALNGADSAGRGELSPKANRIDTNCESAANQQLKAGVGIALAGPQHAPASSVIVR
jgi:hypothetical protein